MTGPDPKPERRIVDKAALRRARLASDACAACGCPPANGHHVIPKSEGGDDVPANMLMLCGSGTDRCHGAWHGNPYVVTIGPDARSQTKFEPFQERRDRDWVARRIGRTIALRRPDTVEYVLDKLGEEPGRAYLERVYLVYIDLPGDYAVPS